MFDSAADPSTIIVPFSKRSASFPISTSMSTTVSVAILRLPGNDDLPLPAYQSLHAAAMDLPASVVDPVVLDPGRLALVP